MNDHGPIQPEQFELMNGLAHGLDDILNPALPGLPRQKKIGFVLLTAYFGKIEGGRVNYISNGEREDMLAMLRELLARLEGQQMQGGTA